MLQSPARSAKRALSPCQANGTPVVAARSQTPRDGEENQPVPASEVKLTKQLHAQKRLKHAAQQAKSKAGNQMVELRDELDVLRERYAYLQQQNSKLISENDELHEFKRRAQAAEARVRELEEAQCEPAEQAQEIAWIPTNGTALSCRSEACR